MSLLNLQKFSKKKGVMGKQRHKAYLDGWNGDVVLTMESKVAVYCPMDFMIYPFDTQVIEDILFFLRCLQYYNRYATSCSTAAISTGG